MIPLSNSSDFYNDFKSHSLPTNKIQALSHLGYVVCTLRTMSSAYFACIATKGIFNSPQTSWYSNFSFSRYSVSYFHPFQYYGLLVRYRFRSSSSVIPLFMCLAEVVWWRMKAIMPFSLSFSHIIFRLKLYLCFWLV